MIVAILGGGNIGTTMAGYLSHVGTCDEVRLYTHRPDEFDKHLLVHDVERQQDYRADITLISSDLEQVVTGADVVCITFPHFMIDQTLRQMRPFVRKGAFVGIIPGSGGCEFFWKRYYDSDFTLFGFQRVPFIARYDVYGKETSLKSMKPSVTTATIPIDRNQELSEIINHYFAIPCEMASNFLAVTLTPSNPVLHTSRIYDLYYQSTPQTVFPECGFFYKDWTDHASQVLFGIDGELQSLLKRLDKIDLTAVKPLGVHYESPTVPAMTHKISHIPSFQLIANTRLEVEGGWVADLKSRYFVEDFPWGLCIIKGFCEICGVATPVTDTVLHWYEQYMGVHYFVDGKFCGKDLASTGIPQNYGIHTIDDIYAFYGTNKS